MSSLLLKHVVTGNDLRMNRQNFLFRKSSCYALPNL